MKLPYAETVNYWKTGTSAPDKFIQDAIKQVEEIGGQLMVNAYGRDESGNNAYMLMFKIGGEQYKIVWPVLPTKFTRNKATQAADETAAKRQAATFIFHDIKAKCMVSKVLGTRPAFFQYLMLPDGRTAAEASSQELRVGIPDLFRNQARLEPGIIDGEVD